MKCSNAASVSSPGGGRGWFGGIHPRASAGIAARSAIENLNSGNGIAEKVRSRVALNGTGLTVICDGTKRA